MEHLIVIVIIALVVLLLTALLSNIDGYDSDGYDRDGYDRYGYGRDGFNRKGYDRDGYDREGFDRDGFNRKGFNRAGYDRDGYSRDGYNRDGYNRAGYDRDGYDRYGYGRDGFNRKGYDRDGYDREGFDRVGYNREGYRRVGYNRKPEIWEWFLTPEYKRVGIRGEEAAARLIESVLREGDRLFTNVSIEYDGKLAELDNVVVNKYGVFIIEVKNYTGHIIGGEDDYEWRKYKTTDAGNTYEMTVKNPIKQVKRQGYVLARYLEYYGPRVWVRGYAILLHVNSPVQSEYMLTSVADIDRVIHTPDRRMLDAKAVTKITELLSLAEKEN